METDPQLENKLVVAKRGRGRGDGCKEKKKEKYRILG